MLPWAIKGHCLQLVTNYHNYLASGHLTLFALHAKGAIPSAVPRHRTYFIFRLDRMEPRRKWGGSGAVTGPFRISSNLSLHTMP